MQALKLLHNSTEYLPLVLFLAAPPPPETSIQEIMQENGRGSEDEITKDSPTIPVSRCFEKVTILRYHTAQKKHKFNC